MNKNKECNHTGETGTYTHGNTEFTYCKDCGVCVKTRKLDD